MSIFSQGSLLNRKVSQIFVNQKRFSIRESIHRHTEPHKFKKHMLGACEPYIKRVYKLQDEKCLGVNNRVKDLHPLERLLAKELVEDIEHSDYVLFIQYNYTKFQSERVYKNTITKLGGKFHAQNNNVYKETFNTLNYADVSSLFIARNALITGKVDSLPSCVIALRKMPTLLLLAGFIDKHLYNVNQLKLISNTPNIDQCRANLLSTLSTPAITLSNYLEQYSDIIKPQDDSKKPVEKQPD